MEELDWPMPPGMDAIYVDAPFVDIVLKELSRLGSTKVFLLAGRSGAAAWEPLQRALEDRGLLAGPVCCDVGMGGTEQGILSACDAAAAARADCVVTVGGGAVQDAGKIVRLWLGAGSGGRNGASVAELQAASRLKVVPKLPPQIACPNSFAMAELTHVGGITTSSKVKVAASHLAMMPTVVVFDPSLAADLPDWVRYGTAIRGIEHAVGAICSPKAAEEVRVLALRGVALSCRGLEAMVKDPGSRTAYVDCYRGGWLSITALFRAGYPVLGHFVENQYSARFNVHQGSCSGIMCARILAYHADTTAPLQARISEAMGRPGAHAADLVAELAGRLPGVAKEHEDVGVSAAQLADFADFLHQTHGRLLNSLSPKPFSSASDILAMLVRPLARL